MLLLKMTNHFKELCARLSFVPFPIRTSSLRHVISNQPPAFDTPFNAAHRVNRKLKQISNPQSSLEGRQFHQASNDKLEWFLHLDSPKTFFLCCIDTSTDSLLCQTILSPEIPNLLWCIACRKTSAGSMPLSGHPFKDARALRHNSWRSGKMTTGHNWAIK